MKLSARVLLGALSLPAVAACHGPEAKPPAAVSAPISVGVGAQPWGLKRCSAGPDDYPDSTAIPAPARVAFSTLPPDPVFAGMGIQLVTFRSAELVFHVSPNLPQAVIDCTVAAADDAVAFVGRTLGLPPIFDGGPTRDVFLFHPDTAPEALERLDPGFGFGLDSEAGQAFVGHPRGRRDAHAIVQWKKVPTSYLELGAMYAHEWVHMIQNHIRGVRPSEMVTVVEGEASFVAALFLDAVVPGAGNVFWDSDAQRLIRAGEEHPELGLHDLLNQRAHRHHGEITFFAHMTRDTAPPKLAEVRLLARKERIDYETAWKRIAGRDLVDPSLETIRKDPQRAQRPALRVSAPVLSVVRSEDNLWFFAAGFRPGERVKRTAPRAGKRASGEMVADSRGAIAWRWPIGRGERYEERPIELRGESGACSGTYFARVER